MPVKPVFFNNNKNQRLAGKLYYSDIASTSGVIYCHGLFSSKDGYKITRIADSIVRAGFTLLVFDFSFAGDSEGSFSELSIIQEMEDLNCALSFFIEQGVSAIHIIGSSMGGVAATLMCSRGHSRILSLSLIATPVKLDELIGNLLPHKDLAKIHENGFTDIQGIAVHNRFFHELLELDMIKAIASIDVPVLILHGAKDTLVDISNAYLLDKHIRSKKKTVIIADGDHTLTRPQDISSIERHILSWITANSGTPLYKPVY